MKPIPSCSMESFTRAGSIPRLNPSFSRTSALPDLPVTERPPCFATTAPAPAATKEDMVLTFGVLKASPPVPHISIILPLTRGRSFIVVYPLSVEAKAAISSTVSPFFLSPTRKPATWTGVAVPSTISFRHADIVSPERSLPSRISWMAP